MKRSHFVPIPIFLAAVLAFVACGVGDAGPAAERAVTERDSAGIRIVESTAPVEAPPDHLPTSDSDPGEDAGSAFSATPVLRIGALDGPPGAVLFRVVGAFPLSDGSLVVGNAGTYEVRYYGPAGELNSTVGGEGDGPGEFVDLAWVGPAGGDSVAAFDYRASRVTILNPNGEVARTFRLAEFPGLSSEDFPVPRWPRVLGRLESGVFVVAAYPTRTTGVDYEGVREDTVQFYFFGPSGDITAGPVDWPGDENWVLGSDTRITTIQVPFGRASYAAAGPDRLWIGAGDSRDVHAYASDGSLRTILRRSQARRPVTPADVDRHKDARIEAAAEYPEWQNDLRGFLERVPIGSHLPTLGGLEVDARGNIWVAEYTGPDATRHAWSVYAPGGRPVDTVTLPADARVLHLGDGVVVTARTDELSVERVEVWEIPPLATAATAP